MQVYCYWNIQMIIDYWNLFNKSLIMEKQCIYLVVILFDLWRLRISHNFFIQWFEKPNQCNFSNDCNCFIFLFLLNVLPLVMSCPLSKTDVLGYLVLNCTLKLFIDNVGYLLCLWTILDYELGEWDTHNIHKDRKTKCLGGWTADSGLPSYGVFSFW